MNEQQKTEQQIDPDHPWVAASQIAGPAPVPSNIGLEPITIEQDGNDLDAVMLTIIDPTGIKNAILPPAALHQMVMQGAAILDMFQQKQQQGLVVANQNDMRNVVKQQQQFDGLRGK